MLPLLLLLLLLLEAGGDTVLDDAPHVVVVALATPKIVVHIDDVHAIVVHCLLMMLFLLSCIT